MDIVTYALTKKQPIYIDGVDIEEIKREILDDLRDDLSDKTEKVRVDYDNDAKTFKVGNRVLNYKELHDIHLVSPDFAFVVYGDRAYLLSYVQDDADKMRELRFESVIAVTGSDGISNVKTSGIYVLSSDGINIASVSVVDINSENKSYKASEINDGNKNSEIWYPSNKAVTEALEAKADTEELENVESRLSESFVEFRKSTFSSEIVGGSKNLLDWNAVDFGKVLTSDGSTGVNNLRWTTDYIPLPVDNRSVVASFVFTSSGGVKERRKRTWTNTACYDEDKNFISGTFSSTAISSYTATDDRIAYIRMSFNPSQVGSTESEYQPMIEYGTSVSSSLSDYVPYSKGTEQYTLKKECIPSDYHERKQITINSEDGIYTFFEKMKTAYGIGNCDVFIKKGLYNYTNEFVDSVRAEGLRGVPIGNGCKYFFDTGAKLYCEYTGTNIADVVGYFSPLDSQNTGGDYEIFNLDLIAKNVCYALHDESDGADYFVKHYYKDCYIELDNTALNENGNSISKALGGGLGKYEEVVIENCVFKATNPSKTSAYQDDASYHCANRSTITDAKLVITGCYFENRFRTSDLTAYPLVSDFPRIIFTGNSSGIAVNIPNTWNKKVWNNEVRS